MYIYIYIYIYIAYFSYFREKQTFDINIADKFSLNFVWTVSPGSNSTIIL